MTIAVMVDKWWPRTFESAALYDRTIDAEIDKELQPEERMGIGMPKRSRFKSDAFEAIHSSASGMFRVGAIDKAKMRHFDEACLAVPTAFAPAEIKQLRESQRVSQPVFARYLNTSESTVKSGRREPRSPAGSP